MVQQIILNRVEQPTSKEIIDDLSWVCQSMGFSKGRDTEGTAARIFEHVLLGMAHKEPITSDVLAMQLEVNRAVINYHLRQFISNGICSRQRNRLNLRRTSLKQTILEVKHDANRVFNDLLMVAEEVDKALGLENRH